MKNGQTAHVIQASRVEALTIRDIRSLQVAEHIYYCKGTNEEILRYARREAVRTVVKTDDLSEHYKQSTSKTVIITNAIPLH